MFDIGGIVPLAEVYAMFTSLPGSSLQYTKTDFARDIYLLDSSGVTTTKSGAAGEFPFSTAAKSSTRIFSFVDRAGNLLSYYGVHSPSRPMHVAEWLDQIERDYLATFVKHGGAAVKFVVGGDRLRAEVRSGLAAGAAERGYLVLSAAAAEHRFHMPQDLFFAIAAQVTGGWRRAASCSSWRSSKATHGWSRGGPGGRAAGRRRAQRGGQGVSFHRLESAAAA